jgi:hypothetical protein
MRRLWGFISHPITIGVLLWIVVSGLAGRALGPTTCRDGWDSPSIGRQGACSHHGGVDDSKAFFANLAGLIVGGLAGLARSNSLRRAADRRRAAAEDERIEAAKRAGHQCECGRIMKLEPGARRLGNSRPFLLCKFCGRWKWPAEDTSNV